MVEKTSSSFDLINIVRELNMAGDNVREEDISLTPDPNLETPEKMSEYKTQAKNILASKRKNPDVAMDKPAISFLARILIKYRMSI